MCGDTTHATCIVQTIGTTRVISTIHAFGIMQDLCHKWFVCFLFIRSLTLYHVYNR